MERKNPGIMPLDELREARPFFLCPAPGPTPGTVQKGVPPACAVFISTC